VRRRVRQLRRGGFGSLSVDLIYGLPGSTLEGWRRTLDSVLALEVEHISAYLLSLEPHVPLARRMGQGPAASALAPLPAEEGARAQYEALREVLAGAGYRQYEISNFARPGHESRHNQNYWARGDYLGLGPSAHSHRAGRRWANHASMSRYRRDVREGRLPWAFEERIAGAEAAAEWIFLGLRRTEGIAWNVLAAAAGNERLRALEERVVRLERGGFLQRGDGRLRLQPEACFVSNAVFRELLEVF
jgi:oxygen-independent coproporphyrinogen-3 oxidase